MDRVGGRCAELIRIADKPRALTLWDAAAPAQTFDNARSVLEDVE